MSHEPQAERRLFAPAGAVHVSTEALELARAFAKELELASPNHNQIVAFDWADSRAIRQPSGGPWVELGSGIDLAAYHTSDVPADMIHQVDRFRFAIKMSRHIYEASSLRLIDVDANARTGLILR